jgi:hypothetical protein
MPLGTATVINHRQVSGVTFLTLSFAGDGTYPAGGTAAFTAYVKAAVKAYNAAKTDAAIRGEENLTIFALMDNFCGVYHAKYDFTNDKLMALTEANVDATPGDLSGTTFTVSLICL